MRIHTKAVLILLASVTALGATVHFLHAYQMRRNARAVFEQASEAEQMGQPEEEKEYLQWYLRLAPADAGARGRLGLLLRRTAQTPAARANAFYVLEDALRRDPHREDLRREALKLALELRLFSSARYHLEALHIAPTPQEDKSEDAELLACKARCEAQAGEHALAADWYRKAAAAAKPEEAVKLYTELAWLYQLHLKNSEQVRQTIESMLQLEHCYQLSAAHRVAAEFFEMLSDVPRAAWEVFLAKDMLGDHSPEVYLLAARLAQGQGNLDEARRQFKEGSNYNPKDTRLRQELALVELRQGQPEKALEHLKNLDKKDWPDRANELWGLGSTLLEAGDLKKAKEIADTLTASRAAVFGNCLQAQLLVKQQDWGQARLELDRLRGLQLPRNLGIEVDLLLAQCHQRLSNPDQQAAACKRVLERDSENVHARHLLAQALLTLGKVDDALTQYNALVRRAPQLRGELAGVLISRNLRLPPDSRRWDAVEALLQPPADGSNQDPALVLLRATALAYQGPDGRAEARKLAEAERNRDPKQPGPWAMLIALAESSDPPEPVLPWIEQAELQTGPRPEWALVRARHVAVFKPAERAKALAEIEKSLDDYKDPTERGRLAAGLAAIMEGAGEAAAAERCLRVVAACSPKDLAVRLRLCEGAIAARKTDEVARWQKEIRDIEGGAGFLSEYVEAARQVEQARRAGKKELLAEARQHLEKAATLRRSWPRIHTLAGQIFELEGNRSKALERYREAIERGEDRPEIVRHTLLLLYAEGNFADADALIRAIPDAGQVAPLAIELSAMVGAGTGATAAAGQRPALELARRAVAENPKDFRAQIWLGQAAILSGQPKDAEAAFRKAHELAPDAPEARVPLILFLARSDKKKAEKELEEALRYLPASAAALALTPCYEALGKLKEAETCLTKALQADPANTPVLLLSAGFYLRSNQPLRAEPLLRRLLEAGDKTPTTVLLQARRDLALVVASKGGERVCREALALLAKNGEAGGESYLDQRVKGMILAMQPGRRLEAIALLEGSTPSGATMPPMLRYLLARLHEAEGDWVRSRADMRILLQAQPDNSRYLTAFIEALLRHGELEEASNRAHHLAEVAPDSPETITHQAQVLRAQKKIEEAVRLVKAYAQKKDARLDLAGSLVEELGQFDEAERLFRAYAALPGRPQNTLPLAGFLARRQRVAEALKLCDNAWTNLRPEPVAICTVAVLREGKPTAEQLQAVERRLQELRVKEPQKAVYALLLAELFEHHGRTEEALSLYRQVVAQDSRNIIALNNLAYLLALVGGASDEALAKINAAVAESGPLPVLLDTRALVYLKRGQTEQALKDLQQAVHDEPTAAKYFHLAQAYRLQDNRDKAAEALRNCKDIGLQASSLHTLEGPALEELTKWVSQSGSPG
jgi:tetratricopeptide (TPR) repeat protein